MSQRATIRTPERRAFIAMHYPDATTGDLLEWAERWGVARQAITNFAAEIGVRRSDAARRAALSQTALARERGKPAMDYTPNNRDDDYVAACIAQGGFPVGVKINGKWRVVYRAEWAA